MQESPVDQAEPIIGTPRYPKSVFAETIKTPECKMLYNRRVEVGRLKVGSKTAES